MIISIIYTSLQSLPLRDVKNLSKKQGIKGYSKLKKKECIDTITKLLAVKVIQRFFRKKLSLNDTCPISLESIVWPCWSKKTDKGRIYYNLEPLASYLITRGDFRDPSTRKNYTDSELESIDSMLKFSKIKLSKTVKKAKNNPAYYRRIKENEEQIDIIRERLRFLSCNIRENIEEIHKGYADIKEFMNQLNMCYYPSISDYVNLLNRRDRGSVFHMFESMIKIIDDTNFDCQVTKHLKKLVIEWIMKLREKYTRRTNRN